MGSIESIKEIGDFLLELYEKSKLAIFILLLLIWMASASFFMPPRWLKAIGVFDLMNKYHQLLPIIFFATSIIIAFIGSARISSWNEQRKQKRRSLKKITETVRQLTYKEKVFLREFFLQGQDIVNFETENLIVRGLLEKEVLSFTSGMGTAGIKPLKIADVFKTHITRKIVGLPENLAQVSPELQRKIKDERKKFNTRPPFQP